MRMNHFIISIHNIPVYAECDELGLPTLPESMASNLGSFRVTVYKQNNYVSSSNEIAHV